jgi:NDP-sugar pyrophosphorylase family protein
MNVPVVIMAGGKGTRLYPYTQILPKPLIPIGEKTITELIMDHFEAFGCKHFDMIVNYKKNFIKSFFIDNEQKRNVDFIEEPQYLGTGGGLKLLEGKYEASFFVTNCDIIVEEDYSEIMKYHKSENNVITIVSAMKNVTIPYGTIEVSDTGQVIKLNEKPNFSFLTNTGFYVLEPHFLDMIPHNTFIHITDVIQRCINMGEKVGVYPISENAWMDMGQLEELEKMREKIGNDIRG